MADELGTPQAGEKLYFDARTDHTIWVAPEFIARHREE